MPTITLDLSDRLYQRWLDAEVGSVHDEHEEFVEALIDAFLSANRESLLAHERGAAARDRVLDARGTTACPQCGLNTPHTHPGPGQTLLVTRDAEGRMVRLETTVVHENGIPVDYPAEVPSDYATADVRVPYDNEGIELIAQAVRRSQGNPLSLYEIITPESVQPPAPDSIRAADPILHVWQLHMENMHFYCPECDRVMDLHWGQRPIVHNCLPCKTNWVEDNPDISEDGPGYFTPRDLIWIAPPPRPPQKTAWERLMEDE